MSFRSVRSASIAFTLTLTLSRGLPLLTLPLVGRFVDQATFGRIGIALSVSAVAAVVMTWGVSSAVPRLLYEDSFGSKAAQSWLALVRLQQWIATLLAGLTLVLIYLMDLGAGPMAWYWAVAVVLAASASVQQVAQSVAVAFGRAGLSVLAAGCQIAVAGGFGSLAAYYWGGVGYLSALAVSNLMAALILRGRRGAADWSRARLKAGARLALPFTLHNAGTWLLGLSDRLILSLFFSLATVGVYQFTYMLAGALGLLLEGLQAAWSPRYYRSVAPEKRATLLHLLAPSATVTAALSVILVLTVPLSIGIIAPEYELSLPVLVLVGISCVARSSYFILVADLLQQRRSMVIARSTGVAAAVGVAITFLAPVAGIWAAGAGTLAAFCVQAALIMHATLGAEWWVRFLHVVAVPTALAGACSLGVAMAARQGGSIAAYALLVVAAGIWLLLARRALRAFNSAVSEWDETSLKI